MALTSLIQILKVNELRKGVSQRTGRPYEMQDAECALLDDAGVLQQVGVLQLDKSMMGESAPEPGVYMASFALAASMKDRRIGAVLTALRPYSADKRPSAPKAPPAPGA
ncbi:hypothetical protein [Paracidovorax anthurii]|uniref:Uncharacterized protein n=1 Tax=Paracidovorax anthurii TaxID=78229 RepID=A0A328ZBF9_9BURK|nr:hypothetical protein [Paracidovorax anthurii]RAR83530.1 hypothetical protein AX018_101436 [Paracidovorax anthurii]